VNEENTQLDEKGKAVRLCLVVLIFLFVISVCVLGIMLCRDGDDRSIGSFIDLTPDFAKNTKFVIIGGRVFYPTKEAKDYTFPKIPEETVAVENSDDASGRVITLKELGPDDEEDKVKDPEPASKEYYAITRYKLNDNRSRDFRDETKWIELLTVAGNEHRAWTQEEEIDLFRNDEGKILYLSPGTDGYFRFQINNKSGAPVHAVVSIDEPEAGMHLPMIFSLEDERHGTKSTEKVLEYEDAVELSLDLDKDSSGIYRLNWRWPYESGDDTYDGTMGQKAGKYILNTTVYAESVD